MTLPECTCKKKGKNVKILNPTQTHESHFFIILTFWSVEPRDVRLKYTHVRKNDSFEFLHFDGTGTQHCCARKRLPACDWMTSRTGPSRRWKSPRRNVLHFRPKYFDFSQLNPFLVSPIGDSQLSDSSSGTGKVAQWPHNALQNKESVLFWYIR